MIEKNLRGRLILIAAVIVFAVLMIWPPTQGFESRLRGGLDIAGGVSLIYEINTEGSNDPEVAETLKTLLQKRVDPSGVYNLVWRVIPPNRIEIQMPLPPADAAKRRKDFQDALIQLTESRLKRTDLDPLFEADAAARPPIVERLSGGSAERGEKLLAAAAAHDAWKLATAARTASTQPADAEVLQTQVRDTLERLTDAIDSVLATNIDAHRLDMILDMDTTQRKSADSRKVELDALVAKHPQLKTQIEDVVAKHDRWREFRGALDGPEELKRLLRGAGVLEFRILADVSAETAYYREQLQKQGPRPSRGDTAGWFRIDNPVGFLSLDTVQQLDTFDPRTVTSMAVDRLGDEWFVLAKLGENDGLLRDSKRKWQLKGAWPDRDEAGRRCVRFLLDPTGGDMFGKLTGDNLEKQLCILLDGVAYSSARINSQIFESGVITGEFSLEKVQYLVQTMQAGALPARLKDTPISERVLGSSLGQENLRQALTAGLIGAGLVVLLMLGYYLVCGLIANVAMMLNVLLVMAVMCMLNAKFTLDGIAGVILGIGMSVDANVLIYERMREEKDRGGSLRMIIKNGYDKALSTIIDSNVTTLLTCIILYYVGSEEVKGFGLTLGWGVVMNLFTAVFVTRTLFGVAVKYNLVRELRMNRLIGVPNIDWYGMRRIFIPISVVVTAAGLFLMFSRPAKDYLDVEFLGGLSVDIQTAAPAAGETFNDRTIRAALGEAGKRLRPDAERLAQATVSEAPDAPGFMVISVPGVDASRLEAYLTEPLEDAQVLPRDAVTAVAGTERLTIRVNDGVTTDRLKRVLTEISEAFARDCELLGDVSVGSVKESGGEATSDLFWGITTTITNKRFVQLALREALGDRLRIQPRVRYAIELTDDRPFPIVSRQPVEVIPNLPTAISADLGDFVGGAAIYLRELTPPMTIDPSAPGSLADRLRNMRLQPGFQDFPWRSFEVIGVTPAGRDADGRPLYSSVIVATVDDAFPFRDDPERWYSEFAAQELSLARAALDSEQSLRKVTQFKPQIAAQSSTQATIALALSWLMIIVYLWIRFGKPVYGFAGVVALMHDVLVALAFVGFAGLIGGEGHFGKFLLIENFKINMAVVAALLTIIGFSINDTIVIFDRIREDRGRLGIVTPQIINAAVNQCLARTLITSVTVFLTLSSLYVFGGTSVRGFAYCMLIGVITGVYSTVAIAAPLLMLGMRNMATEPARTRR
ncbi:MAG: protein translocase subunit SecD [Planctomycetia bacterium]|nr:MAG: protein translocase subunit SecD [Planctomycetia bacterium]